MNQFGNNLEREDKHCNVLNCVQHLVETLMNSTITHHQVHVLPRP